ncbi:Transposase IS4 [Popillia japonica]|uniref:Transposase IS4 n=1 Tax=Popillia japonica TaxID=7064 RepID=A0AAW1K0X5_POPJA
MASWCYEEEQRRQCREPCFFGSDGTRWKKHFGGRRNVRTRADNIITQLPGVKGEAKEKRTPIEIWNLFITNDMLERIVVYTNIQIELKIYSEQYRTARATDVDELKALFGLLYIAGEEEQPPKYHRSVQK